MLPTIRHKNLKAYFKNDYQRCDRQLVMLICYVIYSHLLLELYHVH